MSSLIRSLALLSLLSNAFAFVGSTFAPRQPTLLASSYLESLQQQQQQPPAGAPITPNAGFPLMSSPPTTPATPAAPATAAVASGAKTGGFSHAPLEYFGFDNLSSKGPRATFDWGTPQDWSRKLCDDGVFRAGSWYCTEGGWQSPNGKAVTEIFYVFKGYGSLGDADGVTHYFGPGDMVIIPKGHTGRWDVNQAMHKVWAVNDHPNIEERSTPIRVQVDHYNTYAPQYLTDTSANDPLYGSTLPVSSASNTFYNVGPTKVGVWTCQKGSFQVTHGARSWFHMLEGVLFVTDGSDGTSKRCVPGDTVMLPAGWYGHIDVIEPAKKVWTTAA